MTTKDRPIEYSASELEDYLVGDLDPSVAARIERSADDDPALATYLAERRAERDAFKFDARRRPFESLVEEADGARPWRRWLPIGFGLAVAAAAAFVFVPRAANVRTKGGLSVKAAVLDGDAARIFDSQQALHPGHRLRLTVDDPSGGFVTVLLEERSGNVDVLYRPDELGELGPGTHLLPGSLELDEVVGRERIYVIMSNERADPSRWVGEIRAAQKRRGFDHGWLPPVGSRVQTIEYEKVRSP